MGNKRFSDEKLLGLVDEDGLSQAEAAEKLGVSRQAIGKRLTQIKGIQAKVRVFRHADKLTNITDRSKDELWRKYESLDSILEDAQKDKDRSNAVRAIGEARKIINDLINLEDREQNQAAFKEFAQQFLALLTEIKREYPDAYKFIKEEINAKRFLGRAVYIN